VTPRRHMRYPAQALLLYAALGVALGMVGWALWIHDGDAAGHGGPATVTEGKQTR
jgi:hypothetical protein